MNVRDLFPGTKVSRMPLGGSPETDAAFEAWAGKFTEEENADFLDAETVFGGDLPARPLFEQYELIEALYMKFALPRIWPEADLNYNHRLRYLSIAWAQNDHVIRVAAKLFAGKRRRERSQYAR